MVDKNKSFKVSEQNFIKENLDVSPKKNMILSNKLLLMKDIDNVEALERRIKVCKKKIIFARSFVLTDNFTNICNMLNPSIRKSLKYTKKLEINCTQQSKPISKFFPNILKLKVAYSDYLRGAGGFWPIFCYKQIAKGFYTNGWKNLHSLDLFIEDQNNPHSLRKLLRSLKHHNKIKVCTIDLALYLLNYMQNLDSLLQFLVNARNLESLSLKSMYFLSKSFCDQLSQALCQYGKLKALKFIVFDDGERPFYNLNLSYFIQNLETLKSLEAIEIEFYSISDASLIIGIAKGFKSWGNLKKIILKFDNDISEIKKEIWESFYENLSQLKDLRIISLKFLRLTFPLWKLLAKALLLLKNINEFSIGFSEGLDSFVKDFYSDLGQVLGNFKNLKKLSLMLSFSNNSYFEKIFPFMKNCKLIKLKIISSMNSSQAVELDSLTNFLSNQNDLQEVFLDLNYSKRAKFPLFNFDSTKKLLSILTKFQKLTEITLKLGGIEDKYFNMLRDFENLPPSLVSLRFDIRKKSLNDKELLSLVQGLKKLNYIQNFYLNADFGNITEETYSLFFKSIFQIKAIHNIHVEAANAILPGIICFK